MKMTTLLRSAVILDRFRFNRSALKIVVNRNVVRVSSARPLSVLSGASDVASVSLSNLFQCWSRLSSLAANIPNIPEYVDGSDKESLVVVVQSMLVHDDFINEDEEKSMLDEIEPYIKRLRYETSHWDNAIHGYRETEKAEWNKDNESIISRIRTIAFPPHVRQLQHVHVLDLSKEGFIKPHVDSVRFCGDTIAGLSLLSSSVMRLVNEANSNQVVDLYLKRRSLYIMRGAARYKFTHEILDDKTSWFKGIHVPRERRISVICRNEPYDE